MADKEQPWWTNARQLKKSRPRPPSARAAYRSGQRTASVSTIEGTMVRRLSAWPRDVPGPPSSYALDPAASFEWGRCTLSSLPLSLQAAQKSESRWQIQFKLPEDARCVGLGERYGGLNLRGRRHTLVTLDDSHHSESTDEMYKCIPFLLVRQGASTTGIFIDSPAPQRWDLDSERRGQAGVELLTRRGWDAYVIGPGSLPEVVGAYGRLTGRSLPPPRWSLGHQQSRWSYPTETRVRAVAKEFRKRRIPCDTLVIDIDHLEDYRVFTISRDRFPHFEKMVHDVKKQGFRVLTIVDPGVKREPKGPLYVDGRNGGVFCRRPDGKLFVGSVWAGPSCFPDFIRADVRKWWQGQLEFLFSRGVAGVWNDMNEPAIFGAQRVLNRSEAELPPVAQQPFVQTAPEGPVGHLEVRSLYGQTMAQASWEAQLSRDPTKRPFVLTRSCYAGMQRYGAVWLGDNKSWFEHLRLSIPMLLNMGLSGIPFCGVDVGGFNESCDAELLMRWYQAGLFYPFFRNHCGLGQHDQEPWAFGDAAEKAIRRLIEVRYSLIPYLEQLFHEHQHTGAPVMRPLEWHFPLDPIAAGRDDQFCFGQDILVAPILERGQVRRPVYLPAGLWHPFDGGGALQGGRYHDVEWSFDSVPAFVRDGSILPIASVVQHTGELEQADITFRCFGKKASGEFRSDDGASLAFQEGDYNAWSLALCRGRFRVTRTHSGNYEAKRRYFVEIDGRRRPIAMP